MDDPFPGPGARLAGRYEDEERSHPHVKATPRLLSVSLTIPLTPSGPRMWSQIGPWLGWKTSSKVKKRQQLRSPWMKDSSLSAQVGLPGKRRAYPSVSSSVC